MKKQLLFTLSMVVSTCLFSQNTLPSTLKGNWLNANDSIEWVISFQPGFAAYDTQFWDYEAIESATDGYKVVLSNKTGTHQINADVTDDGFLMLTVDNQKPMRYTRKKALNPDFKNHKSPPFSGSLLTDDTVTIRGFIEDYDPELYEGKGSAYYLNTLTRFPKNYEHFFEISSDGRFEVKFRAFSPQNIYFSIEGSTNTSMFIVPGEIQMIAFDAVLNEVTLDPRKWEGLTDFEINHYMGNSGLLSEEILCLLNFYIEPIIPPAQGVKKALNRELMPQITYIRWRKQVYTQETASMDSLMTALNCSERAKQIMSGLMETELLADIYTYQINMGVIKQYSHSYIEEMPLMDYNSYKYLFESRYMTINNYMNLSITRQDQSPYKSTAAQFMLDYISNHLLDTSDTLIINEINKKLIHLDNISTNIPFPEESFQHDSVLYRNSHLFWQPYNALLVKYKDVIPDSIYFQSKVNVLNYALDIYGTGITMQMYAMLQMSLIKEYKSLDDRLIQWAQQHITEPVLLNLLLDDQAEKKEAENRYSTYADGTIFIDSIPSIADSDVFFDEILSRYKGKVVYIDFWADWCSPCRAEIKPATKLKKEYEGKDIVFLYFGKSCKKDAWQKVIMQEQMEGYHYWLDENQGNFLAEKFGITGIPHYLMVDKSGKIMEGQPPRPSDKAEIREKLDELLAQ